MMRQFYFIFVSRSRRRVRELTSPPSVSSVALTFHGAREPAGTLERSTSFSPVEECSTLLLYFVKVSPAGVQAKPERAGGNVVIGEADPSINLPHLEELATTTYNHQIRQLHLVCHNVSVALIFRTST
jgi:hypothetical protein